MALVVAGCGGAAPAAPGGADADSSPAATGATLTFRAQGEAVTTGTVSWDEGGTILTSSADGTTFELVVPPAAVPGDTEIRMTPLTDLGGIGDGAVHAVQLEPDGLEFFEFVRLTITPAAPIAVADRLMFEASGDGSDAGPAMIDPEAEPIVLLLEHFSIGGVASVTPQQRATFIEKSASNAESRIGSQIAERVQQEDGGSDTEADRTRLQEDVARLLDEYEREVLDRRREAATLTCDASERFVQTILSLERQRQLWGQADDPARYGAAMDEAGAALLQSIPPCEAEAIQACKDAEDAAILARYWIGVRRTAEFLSVPDVPVPELGEIQDEARKACEPQAYRIDKTVTRTEMNVTFSIRYTGTKCDGPEGEWTIDSAGTLSGYGGTADIGGPLVVEIPEGAVNGTLQGTASFRSWDDRESEGRFTGTATFVDDPATLELTVTSGSGNGYSFGFLDTGLMGPGTLTLPLERGDFCH